MDCEYGTVIKSRYSDQGGCKLNNGFCRYTYYCHSAKTIKNSPEYVNCVRRKKAKEDTK